MAPNRKKTSRVGILASLYMVGAVMSCSASSAAGDKSADGFFEVGPPPRIREADLIEATAKIRLSSSGLSVDTSNRFAVANFFNTIYLPAFVPPIMWTGDVASCTPGTTNPDYEQATIDLVNYFRAMAGLPGDVTLDPALNSYDQDMALMMVAQGIISNNPPPTWKCYTAGGAQAARYSLLSLGHRGPDAIVNAYMAEKGGGDASVGHRRWILYPRQVTMGTGSTDAQAPGFNPGSNAVWVQAGFGARPASPEWVAWPPRGYVPYQVVYPRWSFSRPGADFSATTISMTHDTKKISLTVLPVVLNIADNTIVWEPSGIVAGAPAVDTTYKVTLDNVVVSGSPRSYSYDVTIMDPAIASPERVAWMIY
ncbi:MAG: CAP domain-containing protein [bacterium]